VPAARALVVKDAAPEATGTTASTVEPSRNCTDPFTFVGDTLAVSVMGCPAVEGFADDVRVTVEGTALTV